MLIPSPAYDSANNVSDRKKGLVIIFLGEASQQQDANARECDRHRRSQDDIGPHEPTLNVQKRRRDADHPDCG